MANKQGSHPDLPTGQSILFAGEPLDRARAAMLMLHGRGASAEDILSITPLLAKSGFAYLAPQAAGNAWYPNRFTEPLESNEPWLSAALDLVGTALAQIAKAGIPPQRTVLLGFSQGGCLALEYAARRPQRYGGLVGLSCALIGPDGLARLPAGSLADTPVFLGCSDTDIYVPLERVHQAAGFFRDLQGQVTERIYPDMDHTIYQDEIDFVSSLLQALLDEEVARKPKG